MGKIKIFFCIILLFFVILYFSCDNFVASDYIFYSSPFNIKFVPEIVKPGDVLTITYDYWNSSFYSNYQKYPLYVDGSGDLMVYSWSENKYEKYNEKIRVGVKINEEFLLKNKDKGSTGELWGDGNIDERWLQFKNNVFYEEGAVIQKYISYSEEKYPETYKRFDGEMAEKIKVTLKCYIPDNAINGYIYVCDRGLPAGESKIWYNYFPSVSTGKLMVDLSSD